MGILEIFNDFISDQMPMILMTHILYGKVFIGILVFIMINE